MNIWIREYLKISTFENPNIWRFEHLKILVFEHLNILLFEHLNDWTLKHLYIYTLEHWSIETLNHWNIGSVDQRNIWTLEQFLFNHLSQQNPITLHKCNETQITKQNQNRCWDSVGMNLEIVAIIMCSQNFLFGTEIRMF